MTMPSLVAQSLFSDPRISQAKQLLQSALADHQKQITGIRPPRPELKISYDELLKHFGQSRGGSLYFPYLGSGIGNGALVELADGSVKYDMISGIGVHYFGHSHPMLLDAGVDAAMRDTVMQGNLQQNVESVQLAKTLVNLANRAADKKRIAHCFLTTSGAMANENALKIAFQKHHPASRVLAFAHGFAGRSMALSQITDKPAYRVGLPKVIDVDYIPFLNSEDPQDSTAASVDRLKEHLHRYPKQHACMWIELIQGEGGFYAGSREFFIPILDLLKENNIAIWFDEIQTFARTSQPFAFQHFELDQYVDLLTIGKITQVCATLFTDAYIPKPGLVSQTFTASTSAILAAQRILDALTGEAASAGGALTAFFGEQGRIMQVRRQLMKKFDEMRAQHPSWIKGPFGESAMIAFTPFDGSDATVKKLLTDLFDAGVVAFVCGASPARIRFLPPVGAISDSDIDAVSSILQNVLAAHSK
jgi:4-aminobutyrate aminotransferase-like enzyme